ncbi:MULTISPECIES: maleylpyruvate isomerase N-terminal domain-containing protein [unclassified Frankia]|uniref:maleylpyruvate isomerase N-terminal domain-containing protein n=1 Tax=unclassified Frankia TaxID=2632575 RepID=UPI0009F8BD6E|nr:MULTISPECIES: maleylpyruvate isomerase N-terminal domain-containing protein [unclassified Frankia]
MATPSAPHSDSQPVSSSVVLSEPPQPPEYTPSAVPLDRLLGCARAHARLLELLARVDDAVARRPSLLPGWTVGHLITHLARNADSHADMLDAARDGYVEDQYPGGPEQRNTAIEAGAGRPAQQLVADVADSVRRLERAWDDTHVNTWRGGLGRTSTQGSTSLADLVFLRWREIEVHLVDLGLTDLGGPNWGDLSPAYIEAEWAWSTRRLVERLPSDVTLHLTPGDRPSLAAGRGARIVRVDLPAGAALRWMAGRAEGDPAWPTLAAWT